jgi:hypothetical protein
MAANNNKCSLVVTKIEKVGTNLIVHFSEIELGSGKVKKSCKTETISLL